MKHIPAPLYKAIALVTTFSLVNMSVPFGALAAFAPDPNAPRPMPAPEVKAAQSRLLTAAEMKGQRGRLAENPYIAGASKFAVNFHGIDLMTGNYSAGGTDLTFEGGYGVPVNVTRSYSANNPDEGPFGKGWTLSVDIRTTAGGLLKSSSAPIRSVPTAFKERPGIAGVGQPDPNLATEPVEAVVATDASGKEETIQKDVDGILTTPPWDKNVVDSEYEMQTLGGAVYRVLLRNVLKTAEGTVYVYEKMGSYPGGARPWNGDPQAPLEPSNVLKIASVTDRHCKVTTYTYGPGTILHSMANGQVEEHPLVGIQMPNGHAISFTWGGLGVPDNKIRLASDGIRTVTYGYTSGLLTSVTSPAGKTTGYGYGPALGQENFPAAQNLLTSITDPRGLQTQIAYFMTFTSVAPYEVEVPAPVAYMVREPNGVIAYFSPLANKPAGVEFPTDMDEPGVRGGFQERVGSATGQQLTRGYLSTATDPVNQTFSVRMGDNKSGHPAGSNEMPATLVWSKTYNFYTQDLVGEISVINPWRIDDLGIERKLRDDGLNPRPRQRVETETAYNFMGAPLRKTVKEFVGPLTSPDPPVRAQTVEYAYWGADKYFQQKAVKDNAGRISFTDYFDDQAAQGSKGQTYRVYSPKFTAYSNAGGADWKTVIVPTDPATHAAQFAYDAKGRPTNVWKLQKTTPAWAYVQTQTTYGPDQAPTWGAAVSVVEDYGGVNRTTQTLEYDSIGRATQVQDASGQQFTTVYDLDGQVQYIDKGVDTVVSYVYGSSGLSNGVPLQVTDHLTGIVQNVTYEPMGGGLGQVAQVTETRAEATYTVSYTYTPAGERSVATYDTPNGIRKWEYSDYLKVGPPEGGSRIFQTLTKLVPSGNEWIQSAEQFHYEFDAQGRLLEAAFAQTPQPGQAYSAQYPAAHRARAHYEYDPGGRTVQQVHWWDDLSNNVYQSTPVLASAYLYDPVLGLKTDANLSQKAPSSNDWVSYAKQQYAYDPQLDYLTSASYDDDGNGTWEATHTWTYDAAGNRASASAQPGTWAYDNLNRMTQSPMGPYENDILGNRLWKNHNQQGGQRMEWDALNRMTSACTQTGGARYEYRADGMRTLKVEGLSLVWQEMDSAEKDLAGSGYYDAVWSTNKPTTRYFYDGQMPIEDDFTRTVNNQVLVDVTRNGLGARGIDVMEKTTASGTITAFPLYDGHGNMVATLSRSGPGFAVNDRRSFDAWGAVRTGATTGDPKGRYVANLGHVQDDESGLVYMRARYYEASTGRFVNQDPSHQGANWYVYCGNEPNMRADATGRFWWFWLGLVVIGALAGMACYSYYQIGAGDQITTGGLAASAFIGAVTAVTGGLAGAAALEVLTAAAAGEILWSLFVWGVFGTAVSALGGALQSAIDKPSGVNKAALDIMGGQFLIALILWEMNAE